MADQTLPPLPEPLKTVCIVESERGLSWTYWRTPSDRLFTGEQMRAYATAALASRDARIAELERDAARYVWLRENAYIELACDSPKHDLWHPDALDRNIDAAMSQQPKEQGK